eukprot:10289683-Alexandrium_andersonii.AAC.1
MRPSKSWVPDDTRNREMTPSRLETCTPGSGDKREGLRLNMESLGAGEENILHRQGGWSPKTTDHNT